MLELMSNRYYSDACHGTHSESNGEITQSGDTVQWSDAQTLKDICSSKDDRFVWYL